jgi:hypothetical protein
VRPKLLAVLAASSVLLSGCYPAFGSYYHVSSTEGEAAGTQCHDKSGPLALWVVTRGGIRIEAAPVTYGSRAGKVLVLQFYIPSDDAVRLNVGEIRVTDKAGTNSLSNTAPEIYVYQGKGFVPASLQMVDGNGSLGSAGKPSMFRIEIDLDVAMPEELLLHLPQMEINGTSYPAVIVNYENRSGAWIDLLNC